MFGTVVYLDLVILSTILVNYLFIKATSILIKQKLHPVRLLIGLSISLLSLLLFLVPIKYIYNLRYFIGILIGYVSFKKNKYKLYGVSIIYLMNLSLIGTLVIFNINSIVLLIVLSVLIIFLEAINIYMTKVIKPNKLEYNALYNIQIGNLNLIGFLDTGNNSNYQTIPIIYIPSIYFNDSFTFFKTIEVTLIIGTTTINLYNGPDLIINKHIYKCLYSFSKEIDKVILNINMEEEND